VLGATSATAEAATGTLRLRASVSQPSGIAAIGMLACVVGHVMRNQRAMMGPRRMAPTSPFLAVIIGKCLQPNMKTWMGFWVFVGFHRIQK